MTTNRDRAERILRDIDFASEVDCDDAIANVAKEFDQSDAREKTSREEAIRECAKLADAFSTIFNGPLEEKTCTYAVESVGAWRACAGSIAANIRSLLSQPTPKGDFQSRVQPWMMACFGPEISGDKVERGDRILEETFELLQSGGYDPARVLALRDYVWNRPAGEPHQEVGGVMVTLAAYCLACGLDMHQAGETELARIWTKVEKIRAKQAAKPTGSALPIAQPIPDKREAIIQAAMDLDQSVGKILLGDWAGLTSEFTAKVGVLHKAVTAYRSTKGTS